MRRARTLVTLLIAAAMAAVPVAAIATPAATTKSAATTAATAAATTAGTTAATSAATAAASTTAGTAQSATTTQSTVTAQSTALLKAQADAADAAAGAGTRFVAKEVLVTFRAGTTVAEAEAALAGADSVTTRTVTAEQLLSAIPAATLQVSETSSVANAVAQLEKLPCVRAAQENRIYRLTDDGSDEAVAAGAGAAALTSAVAEASGTTVTTQSVSINDPGSSSQWSLSKLGLFDAWSIQQTNKAVTVAIIDTGANVSHADLAANVVDTYNAYVAANVASPTDSQLKDVTDAHGHGTHVAGIVSAVSNNGVGVSGTSYNAGLLIIKACDANGSFEDNSIIAAYNYVLKVAKDENVRVVNMSLGGPLTNAYDQDSDSNFSGDPLITAIDKGYTDYGIVTVAAAGNAGYVDGTYVTVPYSDYPADYSTIVSVINTDSSNARNTGSNYNGFTPTDKNFGKNISAPGTSIYSTTKDGSYGYMTGTSMASPAVAGIMALIFAHDESLTAAEAKAVLYSTATDLGATGWDAEYGYGMANATAALVATGKPVITPECISLSNATYTGSAITGNVTVTVNGVTLRNGTDYSVTYSNNVNAGTATATVKGIGNYTGGGEGTFSISRADISGAAISGVASSYEYTGSAVAPAPTLTYAGRTLSAGTDYTASYADDVEPGTATLTVAGTGNFAGTATRAYGITSRWCADVLGAGPSGAAFVIYNRQSGLALDVAGASAAAGANVQQWWGNETPAQHWLARFVAVVGGRGYYALTSACGGKALDVQFASAERGGNVWQYDANGTSAQQWLASGTASSFVLTNAGSGLALDVSGGSSGGGANVQQWTPNGTGAQSWSARRCEASGVTSGAAYELVSDLGWSKTLDVAAAATWPGANVWSWTTNHTAAQRFYLNYDASTGYYEVVSAASGLALDVAGALAQPGANVQTWERNGTLAQRWAIVATASSGCYLTSACNGLCLDISGADHEDGANVQVWTPNGTAAQRWWPVAA